MPNFDPVTQLGLDALKLSTTHAAKLDPRLPSGLRDLLRTQLTTLTGAVPAQKTAKTTAAVASAAQGDAMERTLAQLSAMRLAVRENHTATATDKKLFGVGLRVSAGSPKQVLAAAASVVAAGRANAQRAAALGLLATDFDALEQLRAAAASADNAEDVARNVAPVSTKARNAAVRGLKASVKLIAGAGALAFAHEPLVRAEFEALLEGPKKSPPPGEKS